jgi:tRNA1(Val) A37 N6-methylase TrmN6
MKLAKMRQLADKLLVSRGLKLSPRFSYGYSLALDIRMIWSDLNLDAPQTVVDIGANTGMFSKEISGYFSDTRILAVEPNPDLHNLLRENARVEAMETAISASKGLASLNYYRVNG